MASGRNFRLPAAVRRSLQFSEILSSGLRNRLRSRVDVKRVVLRAETWRTALRRRPGCALRGPGQGPPARCPLRPQSPMAAAEPRAPAQVVDMEHTLRRHLLSRAFLSECHRSGLQGRCLPEGLLL